MRLLALSIAVLLSCEAACGGEPLPLVRTCQSPDDSRVFTAAFSPDGKTLATGTWEGNVHLWDPASGELRRTIRVGLNLSAIVYSPDGRRIAVGFGTYGVGVIAVCDLSTGKLLWQESEACPRMHINPVAFLEDGRLLAHLGRNSMLHIRESATGKAVREFPLEPDPVKGDAGPRAYSFAVSADGRTLAVGAWYGGRIHLWNLASGKLIRTLQHDEGQDPDASAIVTALAFSPDGKSLVSGLEYATVRTFDLATGKGTRAFKTSMRVEQIGVAPDSKSFVTGLHMFDLPGGRLQTTLPMQERSDRGAVAISPDGGLLATGEDKGAIRLWRLANRK